MDRRNSLRTDHTDVKWMTYDRLRPNEGARNFPCVKVSTDKDLTALSFPPTTEIDLWSIANWNKIQGKSKAVLASPHFDKTRQRFLADRLDYWDEILASGVQISPGDNSEGE
ncbi:hypothetical protein [Streptomyces sp. NPDC048277]|uniref:hypothetical protein n=1 Tax=Streptomyces sp. NPDC048277 TaxID=3155027 RepID=UPI0033F9FE1C